MKKLNKRFSGFKDGKNKEKIKKIQEREIKKKNHKAESDKIKKSEGLKSYKPPKRMTGNRIAAVTSTHTR